MRRPRGRVAFATGGIVLAGAGVGVGLGLRAHADAVHQAQVNHALDALGLAANGLPRGAGSTASPSQSAAPGGASPAPGGAAAGASGGTGGGGSGAKTGGGSASPTPYAVPTPYDGIEASPNLRVSNCQGYPRNVQCKVPVAGAYYLKSEPTGEVVIQVLIDDKVAASHTIQAPQGGYRFQWTMEFTVPSGSHEVDYQALLENTSGGVLAKSYPYKTQAS